jgi:hypothetical protein
MSLPLASDIGPRENTRDTTSSLSTTPMPRRAKMTQEQVKELHRFRIGGCALSDVAAMT